MKKLEELSELYVQEQLKYMFEDETTGTYTNYDPVLDMKSAFESGYLASRWIPIEESKPDVGSWVLVLAKEYHGPTIAEFDGSFIALNSIGTIDPFDYHPIVTHWMPLPEKP